jgi:hypothetical protein
MRPGPRRLAAAALLAIVPTVFLTAVAFANVTGKTLNTVPCDGVATGCAIYSDPAGFSGTISGDANTSVTLVDYICVGIISEQFAPYAGTYTFKVYDGTTLLASTTETVAATPECTGNNNAVTSGGATFTFPVSGIVNYTLAISGITSSNVETICPANCHTIKNRVFAADGSHADSASVGVVGGPPVNVPEAPFASLLVISGAVVAAFVVWRQLRRARPDPTTSM